MAFCRFPLSTTLIDHTQFVLYGSKAGAGLTLLYSALILRTESSRCFVAFQCRTVLSPKHMQVANGFMERAGIRMAESKCQAQMGQGFGMGVQSPGMFSRQHEVFCRGLPISSQSVMV